MNGDVEEAREERMIVDQGALNEMTKEEEDHPKMMNPNPGDLVREDGRF